MEEIFTYVNLSPRDHRRAQRLGYSTFWEEFNTMQAKKRSEIGIKYHVALAKAQDELNTLLQQHGKCSKIRERLALKLSQIGGKLGQITYQLALTEGNLQLSALYDKFTELSKTYEWLALVLSQLGKDLAQVNTQREKIIKEILAMTEKYHRDKRKWQKEKNMVTEVMSQWIQQQNNGAKPQASSNVDRKKGRLVRKKSINVSRAMTKARETPKSGVTNKKEVVYRSEPSTQRAFQSASMSLLPKVTRPAAAKMAIAPKTPIKPLALFINKSSTGRFEDYLLNWMGRFEYYLWNLRKNRH